eukprot:COSAG02_NODE_1263_length_13548_cov_13.881627_9_plen_589_part_00
MVSAAAKTAALIAARALHSTGAPQDLRALERIPPRVLVRQAFRATLPVAAVGRSGGGIVLAPGFEALRLATALAADLKLGVALRKLANDDEDEESSIAIEQIERGMWMISARAQAAQIDHAASRSLVEQQLQTMVSMAREEHHRLAGQCTDTECPFLWVEALNHAVFTVGGFRANSTDYYNPSNSIISAVFQQRTGLPITCGIVYMMVAHRLGLASMVRPTNFPFHFLLRLELGYRRSSDQLCSCVAAAQESCSGVAAKSASLNNCAVDSKWEQVAGLWVSVDPETGPELFRLRWAHPAPAPSDIGEEVPVTGRASTRWLIGSRITHGRMDSPGGLKAPSAPTPPLLRDHDGEPHNDGASPNEIAQWEEDEHQRVGLPYPPRVRWFKVALPFSAAPAQSTGSVSFPGCMVASASLPLSTEGVEDEEGEYETRLSCRVEVHAADKQAQGRVGAGETVTAGIGRRKLEIRASKAYHRGRDQNVEEGADQLSPRSQPPSVLQLHQVSAHDTFFIDPFCAGQLLPDWYLLQQALSSTSAPTRADLLPLLDTASPRTVLSRVMRNLAMAHSQQPNGADEAHGWSRLADSLNLK